MYDSCLAGTLWYLALCLPLLVCVYLFFSGDCDGWISWIRVHIVNKLSVNLYSTESKCHNVKVIHLWSLFDNLLC